MGNSAWILWKSIQRLDLLKEHFLTVDAGVIDSDFRGIVQVLLINHHKEKTFTVRAGCVYGKT